jgi:hypothetical protein
MCGECGDFALIFNNDDPEPAGEQVLEDSRGILKYLNLLCSKCGEGQLSIFRVMRRDGSKYLGKYESVVVAECKECKTLGIHTQKGEEPMPLEDQILILNSPPFEPEPMTQETLDKMTVGGVPFREYQRRQVN